MRFYRLFARLLFIALLVPAGAAWAGAGNADIPPASLLAERECSLRHVCQGGRKAGQDCTANLNEQSTPSICMTSYCPGGGKCVVKYVTDINPAIIPGTMTIIADDQPLIQQGECAARTILLRVRADDQPHGLATTPDDDDHDEQFDNRADDQPHVLANTALVKDKFTENIGIPLERRLITTLGTVSDKFRFRRADSDFAQELIHLFKLNVPDEAVPVIARVGKLIIDADHGNHVDDPLGSVLSFRVKIRFAFPKKDLSFSPRQDDDPCPTDP